MSLQRRRFLRDGALAGAAWTIGASGAPAATRPWHEASIGELQAAMPAGVISRRELTQSHLTRIAQLNPLLHAVIESNPQALQIAGRLARGRGLKAAFDGFGLDAIAIPTAGFSSSHAAVAGYPNLSLPVGFDAAARPVGLCLVGNFHAESRLLSLGYHLEQALKAWRTPTFSGTPYAWDGAALCNGGSTRGALRSGLRRRKALRRF